MKHPTDDQGLFQEIEEDLQRQRLEALWKRYGALIVGAAMAIVLATSMVTGWQTYKTGKEQKATSAFLEVFNKDKTKGQDRLAALETFAKANGGTSQSVLAQLEAASLALSEGKNDEAIKIYDALAADPSVTPFHRQFADLLSVQAQLDTGDAAKLEARLQPLTKDSAWRFSAKEYLALLALRQGDKAKAKTLYQELQGMPDLPLAMSQRVNDILQWLNGAS